MSASAAEYDEIGSRYSEAKTAPWRLHLEAYTLEQVAGDVGGLRVLDLACGDGFYSRRFMRRGARATLGVDVSAEMVALARRAEATEPLGCRYLCSDVTELHLEAPFDLAVAAYLFNYARSRAELVRYCAAAFAGLRPGGRLVGVNDLTDDGVTSVRDFSRHGFCKSGPSPYVEGGAITWEFALPAGRSFAVTNYLWKPETYLTALRDAGFRSAEWHPVRVSPEGRSGFPDGFWDDLLVAGASIGVLEARR
jgi:SAM-dependent methyltransferase